MASLRNSTVPDERRHQPRHRLSSILYVELGPGNGGIIVSLGTGGLSLHAATKLNAEMELNLRFQLEPTKEPIEVAGRVAWLGPTQKEAGISFKDLPADTERRIADWIAVQEQAASVTQLGISPQPKSPSMRSAEAPLSMRGFVPARFAAESSEYGRLNLSGKVPRRPGSEASMGDSSTVLPGLQSTTSAPPTLAVPSFEEQRVEMPSDKLLRLPPKRTQALLEPAAPAPAAKEVLPRDSRVPSLLPAPAKVTEMNLPAPRVAEVNLLAPRVDDSAALKLQRRRLAAAAAACAVGILALVTAAMNFSKPPGHGGSGRRESAGLISPTAGAESGSVLQTAPGLTPSESVQSETSTDDPTTPEANYDLLPILPSNQPTTVPQDDWAAHMEEIFGMEAPEKVNPLVLGFPVWAVQHSGFYYCGDNLNSETPQPGALMTQGEALQSGYQPKLGQYCN